MRFFISLFQNLLFFSYPWQWTELYVQVDEGFLHPGSLFSYVLPPFCSRFPAREKEAQLVPVASSPPHPFLPLLTGVVTSSGLFNACMSPPFVTRLFSCPFGLAGLGKVLTPTFFLIYRKAYAPTPPPPPPNPPPPPPPLHFTFSPFSVHPSHLLAPGFAPVDNGLPSKLSVFPCPVFLVGCLEAATLFLRVFLF